MSDVQITRRDAEKLIEHLEAWSLVLRTAFPQRLLELLQTRLDQTGVLEPLRYDLPIGPAYVADSADELRRRLLEQLGEEES